MTASTTHPTITTTTEGAPFVRTLRDTWLIYRRSLILTLRQPVWVAMGLFQPVLYLFLFAPLLEGAAMATGPSASALNWFVPGLLILTAFSPRSSPASG